MEVGKTYTDQYNNKIMVVKYVEQRKLNIEV